LYPHIFKVIGTFTLGIVLSLTASADSDAIRPVSAGNEVSANTAANTGRSAATSITGGLQRLEELNLLSGALVEKAGSGSTPAHEFRIEARMYRELLRQTMLGNRAQPAGDQLPQHLLLDMVRMSALLHSAADCKTGFVITCPADLILQLKSQQSRVTQGLKMIRMMHE
jgi:hypothetical protein